VVAKLSGALEAALKDPAVRKRIEEAGAVPPRADQMGPEALRILVRSEVERWSTVVKAAGIEPQ
jgi:tripartite-type tricarboxylate transporter receptor subunit TctC